jgi:hypothetical protein
MKLTVAFRNFANSPKKLIGYHLTQDYIHFPNSTHQKDDTERIPYRGNTHIRHRRIKCSRHDEPVPRIYVEPFKDRLPYILDK